jgi:hypothetical protein
MWFSVKRTTCSSRKPQLSTGNPRQPRDLQFSGPFVEMFFCRAQGSGRYLRFSLDSHADTLSPEYVFLKNLPIVRYEYRALK